MSSPALSGVRARLLLLVLLSLAPALWLMFVTASEQRRLALDEARTVARRIAETVASDQTRTIEGAELQLRTIARLPEVHALDGPACARGFADWLAANPIYADL